MNLIRIVGCAAPATRFRVGLESAAGAVRLDVDIGGCCTLVDADGAVGIQAAASVSGAGDIDCATCDADVAVNLHASAIGGIGAIVNIAARLVDGKRAAAHHIVHIGFDALGSSRGSGNVDGAAIHGENSSVFGIGFDIAVIVGSQAQLEAIVTHAGDVDVAAVDLDILVDIEAIAHSTQNVD